MSGFSTLVQWVCTHKSPVENAICTKTTRRIAVCHLRPSHLVAFQHSLESEGRARVQKAMAEPS